MEKDKENKKKRKKNEVERNEMVAVTTAEFLGEGETSANTAIALG